MSKYEYVNDTTELEIELSQEEAIASILLLSIQVTVGTRGDEFSLLNDTLGSLEGFEDYSPEALAELGEKVREAIEEYEPGPLFQAAIRQVPEDLAEAVADMVVKITLENEEVTQEEKDYWIAIGTALGLDADVISDIVADNLQDTFDEDYEEEGEEF